MAETSNPLLLRILQSAINAVRASMVFLMRDAFSERSLEFREGCDGHEPNPYKAGTQQHADWEAGHHVAEMRIW